MIIRLVKVHFLLKDLDSINSNLFTVPDVTTALPTVITTPNVECRDTSSQRQVDENNFFNRLVDVMTKTVKELLEKNADDAVITLRDKNIDKLPESGKIDNIVLEKKEQLDKIITDLHDCVSTSTNGCNVTDLTADYSKIVEDLKAQQYRMIKELEQLHSQIYQLKREMFYKNRASKVLGKNLERDRLHYTQEKVAAQSEISDLRKQIEKHDKENDKLIEEKKNLEDGLKILKFQVKEIEKIMKQELEVFKTSYEKMLKIRNEEQLIKYELEKQITALKSDLKRLVEEKKKIMTATSNNDNDDKKSALIAKLIEMEKKISPLEQNNDNEEIQIKNNENSKIQELLSLVTRMTT